jgi:hypothetical protein
MPQSPFYFQTQDTLIHFQMLEFMGSCVLKFFNF